METKCLENKLFRVGNEMTGQETFNTPIEKDVFYSGTFLVIVLTLYDLTLIVRGSQLHICVRGGGTLCPPLVNTV